MLFNSKLKKIAPGWMLLTSGIALVLLGLPTYAQDAATPRAVSNVSANRTLDSSALSTVQQNVSNGLARCTQALQEALAALEFQTARASVSETQGAVWKAQALEWQKLFDAETQRASVLTQANDKRQDAVLGYKQAAEQAQQLALELKQQLDKKDNEIARLKAGRGKWFGAGFLAGIALAFGR